MNKQLSPNRLKAIIEYSFTKEEKEYMANYEIKEFFNKEFNKLWNKIEDDIEKEKSKQKII